VGPKGGPDVVANRKVRFCRESNPDRDDNSHLYRSVSVFSACGWREGLQIRRAAANILNKQSRTADKGWSSSLEVGRGANNSSP
jgi:hypothetical protein